MTEAQKYTKKPVTIEAMQWDGTFDGYMDLAAWEGIDVQWHPRRTHDTSTNEETGVTSTFEREEPIEEHVRLFVAANDRWLPLEPQEWVLRDSRGFYPCKPDIFEQSYGPAREKVPLVGETYRAEIPKMAPFGIPVTAAGVEDAWKAFIEGKDRPQSVEERILMAVLRSAHQGLAEHERLAELRAAGQGTLVEVMREANEALQRLAAEIAPDEEGNDS